MAKKKLNIAMKDPSGRTTAAGRAYFQETEPEAKNKAAAPQDTFLSKTLNSARTLAEKGRRLLERSKRPQNRTKEA